MVVMTTMVSPLASGVDYVSVEQEENKGSSWLPTSFILANIILGVGLLNFPAAYSDAGGLPTAITMQMFCLVFIFLGMHLIVECAHLADVDTYQDTVYNFCGTGALFICNIFIFLHNFGTCVTFMVILADQIDQVMLYISGPDFCSHWYMSREFTLSVIALLMLPLSFYERMDSFKFISVLGVITTLYVSFLVIWKYFTFTQTNLDVQWAPYHWADIFRVIPVICFSFEGHIEAVPLYACLKKRTQTEFTKVAMSALLMCLVIYTLVGSLAYLTLGNNVPSDLLNAYNPPDIPVIVGTAIMGVKAIVTYPEIMFCSRMVLDDSLKSYFNRFGLSATAARFIETIILFILCLVLAHLVPTIGSVIAILGGSASLFVFVFPGVCTLQAYFHSTTPLETAKKYTGVIMVVIGAFLATTTTVQAIVHLYNVGPDVRFRCKA